MIAPPGCECQPEEPPGLTVICAMAMSVPDRSGRVPCDVSVPRAKGTFVSPDGGVAQLGATVTATVIAVTTLASPTLSSTHLTARSMPPRPRSPCRAALPPAFSMSSFFRTVITFSAVEQKLLRLRLVGYQCVQAVVIAAIRRSADTQTAPIGVPLGRGT